MNNTVAKLFASLCIACLANSALAQAPVSFAILALQNDTLPSDYTYLPLANTKLDFGVVIGSLRPSLQPCKEELYEKEMNFLLHAPIPVMKVVSARDWIDCANLIGGEYVPLNRLDFVRRLFFSAQVVEKSKIPMERQSADTRFPNYAEHMRWIYHNTLFITLNVPTPGNHFISDAGRNQEYEERMVAIDEWLSSSNRLANIKSVQHVIIFMEANPWSNNSPKKNDPFRPVREKLIRFSNQTSLPISIVYPQEQSSFAPLLVKSNLQVVPIPYWDTNGGWVLGTVSTEKGKFAVFKPQAALH